ncbi:ExbD/TolR family protein [Spirochaeta thermophila]|uniref:Biopolymer transport protein ExbD/TolR n=2 Tax=Winmispira thermophila TaxID=154 RepID=G0GCF3_WINT7|nr:biopolymer transporter ExbD [Spirochaeta thermophila]ADN01886.1 hypothetical protein STHERM_c09390 [Spirochaeta thermophila DSM 6192]AEJ61238.1 Biopolymer transport protein ExbD/TolR [Spirochaeta thermophila DSM 6578]
MRLERRLSPQVNVDLTPLIDVVFQLVIFFMVSSVFKTTPGISLELPTAGTAEPLTVQELVITAIAEDEIYVNEVRTTLEGVEKLLASWKDEHQDAEIQVILEADKEAQYQLVISLLDGLRRQGFQDVGLRTRMKR